MRFRFSLESVLKFRKSVERAEEIALQRIVLAIAGVQQEIREIESKQDLLRQNRDQVLSKGVQAAHLQRLNDEEALLTNVANGFRLQLQKLETSRREQLLVFQNARRDRETLSKIREERHRLHEREQLRQDQKTLDDLFLSQIISPKK